MKAINNMNTKPIKEVLTDVRERFATRANWGTKSLCNLQGCMCLLGGMSVAEGIVNVDDYVTFYEGGGYPLGVGEFEDQSAIYKAMADSRALQFLMNDIATDNETIAFAIKADKDGMHYVDAAWTFNDGHDRSSYRDKDAGYTRLMDALDRAIARA